VFNSLGKRVIFRKDSENEEVINLADFPAGIYFIQVSSTGSSLRSAKVIKR